MFLSIFSEEPANSFGMHDALWDPLPVEIRRFLDQVHVPKEYRPPLSGDLLVLGIGNRDSMVCGESFLTMRVLRCNDSIRARYYVPYGKDMIRIVFWFNHPRLVCFRGASQGTA